MSQLISFRCVRALLVVSCLVTAFSSIALGQLPKIPYKNLGVDTIKTNQRLLFGFVLSQKPGVGVECAIDRQWLKATYPDLANQIETDERKSQIEVQQVLIKRIEKWITQRGGDNFVRLKIFLEDELNRIKQIEPKDDQSVFALLNLPANELSKITLAKSDQRHIAGVAYKHQLTDITITASSALEKRLKELGVDVATEKFDLTDRLPSLTRESDNQWAARQALLEHAVVEAFELQGKGNKLMAAGDPIDVSSLLKQFSSAQDELLQDLAKELKLDLGSGLESKNKDDWKAVATQKAEKKQSRGVLVHRLQQRLGDPTVKVITDFLAQTNSGEWITVFHAETSNDGSSVAKEELDRLQQDPNLKQILPLVESLGGKAQLDQALRQGAATASALNEARSEFQEFLSPNTRSLTSPPIQLPRS